MSDNAKLILICVGGYLLLKRGGLRSRGPYRGVPPVDNTKNMQNAFWAALAGDVWHNIRDNAKTGTGRPIVGTNSAGQDVTSDGKPIDDYEIESEGWDGSSAELFT